MGCIKEFNVKRGPAGEPADLTRCDLRGWLMGLKSTVGLPECYFRQADLRGIDFRKAKLEGASLNAAKSPVPTSRRS